MDRATIAQVPRFVVHMLNRPAITDAITNCKTEEELIKTVSEIIKASLIVIQEEQGD